MRQKNLFYCVFANFEPVFEPVLGPLSMNVRNEDSHNKEKAYFPREQNQYVEGVAYSHRLKHVETGIQISTNFQRH